MKLEELEGIEEYTLTPGVDVVVIVTTKQQLCLEATDDFNEIQNYERAYYVINAENAEIKRVDVKEVRLAEDDRFRIHKKVYYKFVIKVKNPEEHAKVSISYNEQPMFDSEPSNVRSYTLVYVIHYIPPDSII